MRALKRLKDILSPMPGLREELVMMTPSSSPWSGRGSSDASLLPDYTRAYQLPVRPTSFDLCWTALSSAANKSSSRVYSLLSEGSSPSSENQPTL